ncbi:MAG: metallophosphoesterase family protein [Bacteroidaceae bacterium]|nr:metallophosphoesterase family protein [Bacteroidaceae bacterium]
MMKIRFILALFCLIVWQSISAQTLKFHKDGTFKIVQFTDVHWKAGLPESDIAAENMNAILDAEKPDFVIYTGDLIFGSPAAQGLDRALEPVVSRGIPFAVTWGNHDDEQDMTRQEIFDYMKKKPGNLSGTVPGLSGITNFILPIESSNSKKSAFTLYGIDSNSYSKKPNVKGYDWIKHDQIHWYRENSQRIVQEHQGDTIPALMFFHIPLPEYQQATQDQNIPMIGTRKEMVCAPEINSGMFNAILEMGDVMATFAGHDHINDYAVLWKGILLGYGRYSGGNTVYNNIPGGNGARIILLKEGERSFSTYIRLRTGEIINRIQFPEDFK